TRLPPGAWSSQRHWHTDEDEFVYVLSGELVLVTDAGEQPLAADDCAAFPKNRVDGHHLVNRGTQMAVYLEIGSRSERDCCHYPDVDMYWDSAVGAYAHKDGSPYPRSASRQATQPDFASPTGAAVPVAAGCNCCPTSRLRMVRSFALMAASLAGPVRSSRRCPADRDSRPGSA